MAKLNVNPTRMELTRLKAKLITAKKGHKLLKDKQDELMRIFIETIKKNKEMRMNVEKKLSLSLKNFTMAKSIISESVFEESLAIPKIKYEVDVTKRNVMSVRIPEITLEKIGDMSFVMNDLLQLAQIEKSTQLMADEIEKTRRRVNALEYMTIPQLEETIKFIRMKLDENDRAAIIRLMKANIN